MAIETSITVPNSADSHHGKPSHNAHALFSWIEINVEYFKTIPGIIKLLQLLLGLVCMILASPARMSGTHWFLFIVIIAFIATAIWVFIYFLSVREALNFPVNWVFSELLNTVVFALLYLIVSIIQLSSWAGPYHPQFRDPNIAAGIFGVVNFLVYLVGSYFLYTDLKISRSVGAT